VKGMQPVGEDFSLLESLLWVPDGRIPASFNTAAVGGDEKTGERLPAGGRLPSGGRLPLGGRRPPLQEGFMLLKAHLRRMQAAAEFFGWPFDPAAARAALAGAVADHPGNRRGAWHAPTNSAPTNSVPTNSAPGAGWKARLLMDREGIFTCTAAPLDQGDPAGRPYGVARTPVDSKDIFLRYKTTRRGLYQAALASRPGAQDVLLWNEQGYLTETCIANLVVELEGAWLTPPVSDGLLPGVWRGWLLEQGLLQEAHIRVEDLPRCTRLWAINSVRGWMPARVIAG
jgi:para-aminobenzoate synthetase/4-amino-4-deoxychorismate lyase